MSLSSTHPIFTSCAGSPYQTKKAVVQARYLSGRGRVEALTKHWDFSNKEGNCPLCALLSPTLGTIEHLLLSGGCPALVDARLSMLSFIQAYMVPRPYLLPIMKACWGLADHLSMQLLLDCTVIPEVIKNTQLWQTCAIWVELMFLNCTKLDGDSSLLCNKVHIFLLVTKYDRATLLHIIRT